MTIQDDKLRAAIDETIAPRKDDAEEFLAYAEVDFAVESAELLYVRDQYHTQLLDFSCASGLLPLGHGHKPTMATLIEQLNHYGPMGRPGQYLERWPTEYAKELCYSLDGSPLKRPKRVFYTPDDYSARNFAWTAAQQVTGKTPLVLNLANPNNGILSDLTEVAMDVADARANGTPIIADETLTGFGRTGMTWGQERWDFTPDITIVGGAGGGGFPFGAVVAPVEYFTEEMRSHVLQPPRQAGNPAICAAGYATLKAIDAPLLTHVQDAYGEFNAGLRELQEQFPGIIMDHSGVGLLHFLKFAAVADAEMFVLSCRERGLLLTPTRTTTITLTPPLIASELELRRGIDLMASACLEWMY